jgi:hypothetical protein
MKIFRGLLTSFFEKDRLSWPFILSFVLMSMFILKGCSVMQSPQKIKPQGELLNKKPSSQQEKPIAPKKEEMHPKEIDADKDFLSDEDEKKIGSDSKIANTWEGYEKAREEIKEFDTGFSPLENYKSWIKGNNKNGVKGIVRIATNISDQVIILKSPDSQEGMRPASSKTGWILVADNYLYRRGPQNPEDIYYEVYYNILTSFIKIYFYPFKKESSTSLLVTIRAKNAKNNQLSSNRIFSLLSTNPDYSGKEINIYFNEVVNNKWYNFEFPIMYMFDKNDYLEIRFSNVDFINGEQHMQFNGKIAGHSEVTTKENQHITELKGAVQVTPVAVIPSISASYTYKSTTTHTERNYDMDLKAAGTGRIKLHVEKPIIIDKILSHKEISSFGYKRKIGLYYIEPVSIEDKKRSYQTLLVTKEKVGETESYQLHANAVLKRGKIIPAEKLEIRILVNPYFKEWKLNKLSVKLVGQPEEKFIHEIVDRKISPIELASWKIDRKRSIKYDLPEIISTKTIEKEEIETIKGILLVNALLTAETGDGRGEYKISLPFNNHIGRAPDKKVRVTTEFDYTVRFQECRQEIENGDYYIQFEGIKPSSGIIDAQAKLEVNLDRGKIKYQYVLLTVKGAFSPSELLLEKVSIKKKISWWRDKLIAKCENFRIDLSHYDDMKSQIIPIENYKPVLEIHFHDKGHTYQEKIK